jgi:class 3 adenylate cyclase
VVATTMTGAFLVVNIRPVLKTMDTEALTSRPVIGLTARRRPVTALSVDVVGSMSLCSAMSDEAWWTVVEELFAILSDGVLRFGGWIENFAGDGLVAVFGVEGDQRVHAHRACAAALWIRDAVDCYAAELERARGVELSLRIGINSGDAVIGALGTAPTPRFAAIGHAVGLAKRIETVAAPGRVYIGDSTATLLEGALEVCELGMFEVRGASTPLRLFELLGQGAAPAEGNGAAEYRQQLAVAA